MAKITLIHWNEAEGRERLEYLTRGGHEADLFAGGPPLALRDSPAEAFVIDLSRLPSQGRDFAVQIRQQKTNRRKPLIFAGGAPEKVEKIRALLPDAAYCEWEGLLACLEEALRQPPADPVVPGSFDSYAGAPLAQKLGIRAGSRVLLANAPQGFEAALAGLPEKACLTRDPAQPADVVLLFSASPHELRANFPAAAGALSKNGKLWLAWRKKSGKEPSLLDHGAVQRFGLDAGYMDYKICAIDETWSGLCFTRKKPAR